MSAHVEVTGPALVFISHTVWLDGFCVAATGSRTLADRVAELLNRHGLADVPDHIPTDVLWSPPRAEDVLIDWRLPSNPKECPREP